MLWNIVKLFMELVERPGDGEIKKKEVTELIDNILDDLNIDIPREILEIILSPAIDYLASSMF
ncbi:hypothetical protein SU69_05415 [Thermosipho melanesiensis]|uniref:Uncharacterized protein n=2 Tax=Thermosipho melanesiensis TaxID=46541 RepID=A6LLW9_THEM4|nr:hypothetical protein [Thermosipho melanesiensis]ABR30920.1 hypothetical protein Tmel_1060 [Thermosipho melanesiensis BI429]APT74037.1 hypothetical protein BW47_05665 [Thermosipho melanesiensis]OOC35965.1 hypothetical protein SU68_05475 [Thermosipho melanesiensis]OOC38104.1 hypothetical protein SU69_05415 [Thermosipho melanesiensis]OOC38234.1 hypothetical protein SU70_05425 [Thermosipho melanesiensis]